jgi:acetoacetate decarboxylase
MDKKTILKTVFGMPLASPAFNRPPLQFYRREILSISYKTDIDILLSHGDDPDHLFEKTVQKQQSGL